MMDLNGRIWIVVAGVSGMLAVALGAYGTHGLDGDAIVKSQFDTANRYHMWHTLAMLGAALGRDRLGPRAVPWATGAAALFMIGILMFSGALYAATALDQWGLTFLAPWGGTALMAGWLALGIGALRGRA